MATAFGGPIAVADLDEDVDGDGEADAKIVCGWGLKGATTAEALLATGDTCC